MLLPLLCLWRLLLLLLLVLLVLLVVDVVVVLLLILRLFLMLRVLWCVLLLLLLALLCDVAVAAVVVACVGVWEQYPRPSSYGVVAKQLRVIDARPRHLLPLSCRFTFSLLVASA